MIEQLTPLSEIKGLDTLVQHFRQEYGEPFLRQMDERKLLIGVSVNPQEAVLQWRRDSQLQDLYSHCVSSGKRSRKYGQKRALNFLTT